MASRSSTAVDRTGRHRRLIVAPDDEPVVVRRVRTDDRQRGALASIACRTI